MDVNQGFEQAWKSLHDSFNKAWTEFQKKK